MISTDGDSQSDILLQATKKRVHSDASDASLSEGLYFNGVGSAVVLHTSL